MTTNASYATAAAEAAAKLIAAGDMNPGATCAEAAGGAIRMQPEAAAVVASLASMPASPDYAAAVAWNDALLDLIIYANAQPATGPMPTTV